MPTCLLCQREILPDEYAVPALSGYVHLDCAQRDARQAAQQRTFRAILSAIIMQGLVFLIITFVSLNDLMYIGVLAVGMIAHVVINRTWWRMRIQTVGLWIKRRHS